MRRIGDKKDARGRGIRKARKRAASAAVKIHVRATNKVEARAARRLLAAASTDFLAKTFRIEGARSASSSREWRTRRQAISLSRIVMTLGPQKLKSMSSRIVASTEPT